MRKTFSIIVLALFFLSYEVLAQDANKQTVVKAEAKLIDLFGQLSGDDASSRIDNLINEVEKNPNNKGILFVYCGKSCQYGEVEAHLRDIRLKLNFRGVNNNRYMILPGGYREKTETELWLIPENACPPILKATTDIQDVKFKGTFKRRFVAYDCCE